MSEYTDIRNNTYKITQQSIILSDKERENAMDDIVEALYNILISKQQMIKS